MKCQKCQYEWETKSKHIFVSCPSCLAKVKRDQTKRILDEDEYESEEETPEEEEE